MRTLDALSPFSRLTEIEGSGEKKTVVVVTLGEQMSTVVILGEQMSTVVINVPGLLFIISLETTGLLQEMEPFTE